MRSSVLRPRQQPLTGCVLPLDASSARSPRKAGFVTLVSLIAFVLFTVLALDASNKTRAAQAIRQSRRSLTMDAIGRGDTASKTPVNSTGASGASYYRGTSLDLLRSLDWSPMETWLDLASKAGRLDPVHSADLCEFLLPSLAETVAVVGNGPLSTQDHRDISGAKWIIRFNYMDNLLPGERTDLWIGRTDLLDHSYWQRAESYYPSNAPDAATAAKRHLLLGEAASFSPDTVQMFRVPEEKLQAALRLDLAPLNAVYNTARVSYTPRTGVPTSGFLVAMAAASCAKGRKQKVHVYGANWSRLQLPMLHYSELEATITKGLEDQGLIYVHKPPCGGHNGSHDNLRHCGDVDHAICRESWRNCEQVPFAMLADMFNTFSFSKLLQATQNSTTEVAKQESSESKEATALKHIWEGPEALQKAQGSDFCKPFMGSGSAPTGGKRVAVVGNGPLSGAQRAAIADYDIVVRFNYLNSRLPGEKMDVWVTCFSWDSSELYWGFAQSSRAEALEALSSNATVVLFGGFGHISAAPLLRQFPELPLNKMIYLDLAGSDEQFYSAHLSAFGQTSDKFLTTGFRVVLASLACRAPGSEIHLFGFNWSPRFWEGHDTVLERRVLVSLANAGSLKVHVPPCDGVRRCGTFRDIHDYTVREQDGFEEGSAAKVAA